MNFSLLVTIRSSCSTAIAKSGSKMDRKVMKSRRCTLERAEKFISSDYFTDVNLRGRLYGDKTSLSSIHHVAVTDRVSFKDAMRQMKSEGKPTNTGTAYGPIWATHWFKLTFDIPSDWIGKEVHLVWNSGCEAMVWSDIGEPLMGLNKSYDRKDYYIITRNYDGKQTCQTLYIEMACNGMFGAGSGLITPPDVNKTYTLSTAEIRVFNRKAYELLMDVETLYDMAKHLPETDQRSYQALYTVNQMINSIHVSDETTYDAARNIAKKFLTEKNGDSQHTIHAMGHCHIDSAWLWPYDETKRKCARSWASTLQLMEDYEDFTFVCSQAQQFDWVKTNYPGLYSRLKEQVKRGRFIPVGGTWVEMDGNLPSGEAFIRQFLYGQKFFKEEFGIQCKEFWLPDTFGYSAQLPQVMQAAGIQRFLTQKLSWSLINKFPHNTFHWQGIDGTSCLAHFPPADNYSAELQVQELLKTSTNQKDKGRVNHGIMLFGHGDGGGGPKEDMLERYERLKNCDGIPKVCMSNPSQFFEIIENESSANLCTWVGELYLELHQGTFTTQAMIKKMNRKLEFLLQHVELFQSVGCMQGVIDKYPSDVLDRLWKQLLLNQFHDVLPGSCTNQVVVDALALYEDIEITGNSLLQKAVEALVQPAKSFVVCNTNSWKRSEVVTLKTSTGEDQPGGGKRQKSSLKTARDNEGNTLAYVEVPSLGISPLTSPDEIPERVTIENTSDGHILLQNGIIAATIDMNGRVHSMKCIRSDREAVRTSAETNHYGNQFVMFDDIPLFWDAWDVMDYHLETRKPIVSSTSCVILDQCDLRCSIIVKLNISSTSCIEQIISLDMGCPYLKFSTKVDWNENHKFLKVEFPMNVRAVNATYEIQFGHLQRPTHRNTSWDSARYEVVGHKWADLSEYGWGVALLNDCKYGHSCHENVLSLSLLRSPKSPDPDADMGQHEFTYALFPHEGTFQDAGVIQGAYDLNKPLMSYHGNIDQPISFFEVDNPAVIIETVKKGESTNSMVLRIYEAFGGQAKANVKTSLPMNRFVRCNIMEEFNQADVVTIQDGCIQVSLKPFEFQSIMVYLD
ncbi:alpha-mannosidase 2C1-like [Amphiura filiformis]|uniref:alpha-mannosidase 2C1-like n=1 Tax=Amphiura filiformis TaxID=82378 RepID=UPI003B227EA6